MKSNLKNSDNPEVLLVTKKGENYGMGHYNRIRLIKKYLGKMKITSRIEFGENLTLDSFESIKVVLLDSRDDFFPDNLVIRKKPYQYFIAMDNRGEGRTTADIIWDTLPHPEMDLSQLKTSLRNCIINPVLVSKHKCLNPKQIIRCSMSDLESEKYSCSLVQYPLHKRSKFSEKQFHDKLLKADTVGTYFGQTFFEALFLGKQIYLYDISDYHKKITDWFLHEVQNQPDIINLLDGQGLHRLTVLIRSIISGVLDFPVG